MEEKIFTKNNKCLVIDFWILSYLYENDNRTRKNILKNLCQASFEMLEKPEQFGNSISNLLQEELISMPGLNASNLSSEFSITEKGIISFRKNIINPFVYMKKNLPGVLETDKSPQGEFLRSLAKCTIQQVGNFIAKSIIENAPLVVEIFREIPVLT